jgi:hypothetical protein
VIEDFLVGDTYTNRQTGDFTNFLPFFEIRLNKISTVAREIPFFLLLQGRHSVKGFYTEVLAVVSFVY